MKKHCQIFALLIALLTFTTSCQDDPIPQNLELDIINEDIEIMSKMSQIINIKRGNGGYQAISANPEIAKASIENNKITITPQSKGRTSITIKDRLGEQVVIPCRITDNYASFIVAEVKYNIDLANQSLKSKIEEELAILHEFAPGMIIEFCDYTKQTVKIFKNRSEAEAGKVLNTGCYSLHEKDQNYTIAMNLNNKNYEYYFYGNHTESILSFLDYTASQSYIQTYSDITIIHHYFGIQKTDEYKAKYPDAGIENISVVITTAVFPYKYSMTE